MERPFSLNQTFALISSAIYFSAGVLGFFATGFDDFFGDTDEKLIILGLNPAHNVVHLVLGAAWLSAAMSDRIARIGNLALGAGLLAAFALGMVGGAQFLNIDNAAEPDNYLHLVYGALSIAVALRARATTNVGAVAR